MREKDFLAKILPGLRQGRSIAVGPGDDCAVIDIGTMDYLLFAVDQLVSGIHFDQLKTSPGDAGRKLLKRNLSDIAAMGGIPSFALLAAAADFARDGIRWTEKFIAGIEKEARRWDVSICGGDLAATARGDAVFSLSIAGNVEKNRLCLRSGAKDGDLLFCTGRFGNSYASGHHLSFVPRMKEARFLAGKWTRTMIDVSDGLLSDAAELSVKSGLGIRLETQKIPLRMGASLQMALGEGEDYELLFAVSRRKANSIIREWPFPDVPIAIIGEFSSELKPGAIMDGRTNLSKMFRPGYDHLARNRRY